MRLNILLCTVFLLGLVSCNLDRKPVAGDRTLHEGWIMYEAGRSDSSIAASVPGCVHLDLLKAGRIADPYYRTNEHNLQWIDKKDWVYETRFKISPAELNSDVLELDFEGLDTYAEVFFNDSLLGRADNMFRQWTFPIKQLAAEGENKLKIIFRSPIAAGLKKYNEHPYVIPVSDNDQSELGGTGNKKVSVYTRKAGYHFGWDWGPRLVTSGIWRPVKLKARSGVWVNDLFVRQITLSDEEARLTAEVEVRAAAELAGDAVVYVNGKEVARAPFLTRPGVMQVAVPFTISAPERWWPAGMGAQKMYEVTTLLEVAGKKMSSLSHSIGLRTLRVVQKPDAAGKSFYAEVNGVPVFMKGANYIPQDVFLPRVTSDHYRHIIATARDANMNTLRVWGGGVYENDLFYRLCDSAGIMVWQDFMFACAMFPGDSSFLANVKAEAEYNVKRLRNHPSIALWCGNNEILAAWHQWGWKKKIMAENPVAAKAIEKNYAAIFHEILPGAVAQFDSSRFYWSSSPSAGTGQPENWMTGDVHYWGVWWGQEPFSDYTKKIGRFMSEYGFQSFPEFNTVKKYTVQEDWDIYSPVMKSHQRSSIGNGTIENYLKRQYRQPKDFENFLYVGQLLQAEGIKTAIEAHRTAMPYCMGSLYWQINDCWPVASWSSMDYYGNRKALHYVARRAFADVLTVPSIEAGIVKIQLVSDLQNDVPGKLLMKVVDFDGTLVSQTALETVLKKNTSLQAVKVPVNQLLKNSKPDFSLLYVQFTDTAGRELASNILYFVDENRLRLPPSDLTYTVEKGGKGEFKITLTGKKLSKNVWISLFEKSSSGSDNFFDLLPGTSRKVTLNANEKMSLDEMKSLLRIKTLDQTY